jgi:predicted DNA-binding transcriptional regulator YafY
MTHPASRILALLELLQAHRRMTGPDLAARLAVDERTVRRYARTLVGLGIPVTAERGRYGGYRLMPGFKLPPLMLTDDEAVAVVLGLIAADRLGLSTEAPATAAAAAKIARVLPPALADRLAALRDSLGFTLPPTARDTHAHDVPTARGMPAQNGPTQRDTPGQDMPAERDTPGQDVPAERDAPGGVRPATDTVLTLGAATRAHERLTLTYRARTGDTSRRDFDPYGLVFHKGRWYAVGQDHRRAEIRSFRLDRIVTVERSGATFEAPDGFDAVAHLNRQWAGLPWLWEVEVLIEADVAQVRRRVPANVADVTEAAGGVLLRCRAQRLDGMAQMLSGLGWPFTVVRPDELHAALAEHAARLTQYAGRTAG